MGFTDAKRQLLECLRDGRIEHDLERSQINVKNLLATGVVSAKDVAQVVGRVRGGDYECRSHHFDATIDVHIIRTHYGGKAWYIKWYFVAPNVVFISVH